MRPSPDPRAGGSRIAELDGLRGLAALAVLVFHAWLYTLPTPDAGARSSFSDFALHELRLGLILFFALSGFVLFRPWVRAALDGTARPSLRRYAHSRGARILPAYYVAMAGSVVLLWGIAGAPGVRLPAAEELWRFLFFAQNFSGDTVMTLNPPTWTLVIEICFYVVLPLIGWLALRLPSRRRALLAVPVGLTVLGLVWTWAAQELGLPLPWRKSLPAMLPYFATGMAAAILVHGRTLSATRARTVLLAGLALVAVNAALQSLHAAGVVELPWATIWRDLPAAVGFGAVLGAVAARPRAPRRLGAPPLAALGTVSYGVYLWHMPLLLWLLAHGALPRDPLGATLVLVPVSVAVAAVSWVAVERPALARVDARRRSRQGWRPTPVSARAAP